MEKEIVGAHLVWRMLKPLDPTREQLTDWTEDKPATR
jgi:hypothetical protein